MPAEIHGLNRDISFERAQDQPVETPLRERWQSLVANLDAISKSDPEHLDKFLVHISAQSIEDGLNLLERFGCSKSRIAKVLADPLVYIPNRELIETVAYKAGLPDSRAGKFFKHQVEISKQAFQQQQWAKFERPAPTDVELSDPRFTKIRSQIDAYYNKIRAENQAMESISISRKELFTSKSETELTAEKYLYDLFLESNQTHERIRYSEIESIRRKALQDTLLAEIKTNLKEKGYQDGDFHLGVGSDGQLCLKILKTQFGECLTESEKKGNLQELFDLKKFEYLEPDCSGLDLSRSWNIKLTSGDFAWFAIKKDSDDFEVRRRDGRRFRVTGESPDVTRTNLFYDKKLDKLLCLAYIRENNRVFVDDGTDFDVGHKGGLMQVGGKVAIIRNNIGGRGGSFVNFLDGNSFSLQDEVEEILEAHGGYYVRTTRDDDEQVCFANPETGVVQSFGGSSDNVGFITGLRKIYKGVVWESFFQSELGVHMVYCPTPGRVLKFALPFNDEFSSVSEFFPTPHGIGYMTLEGEVVFDALELSQGKETRVLPGYNIHLHAGEENFFVPDPEKKGAALNLVNSSGETIRQMEGLTFAGERDELQNAQDRSCVVLPDGSLSAFFGEPIMKRYIFGDQMALITRRDSHDFLVNSSGQPLVPEEIGSIDNFFYEDGYIYLVYQESNQLKVYRRDVRELALKDELRKIEISNQLARITKKKLATYFSGSKKSDMEEMRVAEQNAPALRNLSHTLRTHPDLVQDVLPAKPIVYPAWEFEERMVSLFKDSRPHSYLDSRVNYGGLANGEGQEWAPYQGLDYSALHDGDPKDPNPRVIAQITPPPKAFLATFMGGKYTDAMGWQKINFAAPASLGEKKFKVRLLNSGAGALRLPVILGGSYSNVEASRNQTSKIRKDITGMVDVQMQSRDREFSYSMTEGGSQKITDISSTQYEQFVLDFSKKFGDDLTAEIIGLPESLWTNVAPRLKDLSVLEKVKTIKEYVQEIGYYDFDNREVQKLKLGKSFGERLQVMKERCGELSKRPNIGNSIRRAGKQYAGVCADFTGLTTGLLRRAGMLAGTMQGYSCKERSEITTADAHSMAFVVYPDKNTYTLLPVDSTPSGLTDAQNLYLNSLRLEEPVLDKKKQREQQVMYWYEKTKGSGATADLVLELRVFLNLWRYAGLSQENPEIVQAMQKSEILKWHSNEQYVEQYNNPDKSLAILLADFVSRLEPDSENVGLGLQKIYDHVQWATTQKILSKDLLITLKHVSRGTLTSSKKSFLGKFLARLGF